MIKEKYFLYRNFHIKTIKFLTYDLNRKLINDIIEDYHFSSTRAPYPIHQIEIGTYLIKIINSPSCKKCSDSKIYCINFLECENKTIFYLKKDNYKREEIDTKHFEDFKYFSWRENPSCYDVINIIMDINRISKINGFK